MLMSRQIGVLLAMVVVVAVVAVAMLAAPAFGAADQKASCLGVQRSNAEQGDVGRFSRGTAGQELLGHKGQEAFATQGAQPGRTNLEGSLQTEGSGPPGQPSESLAYSVSCATMSD
jgi:hypothetical protein